MSRGTVVVQIGRSLKINTDQKLSLKNKNQSNKVLSRNISRKLDDRISIKTKKTHHPRVSKSAFAVAKGGGESGGTGFVVPGRLAVVGGGIDGDGPHTGGVSVTVTVVVRAAVARRPHVDVATPMSALRP